MCSGKSSCLRQGATQNMAEQNNSSRSKTVRLTRRGFLLASAVFLGVIFFARKWASSLLRDELKPHFDQNQKTGELSQSEMKTMMSLLEVLIPLELSLTAKPLPDIVNESTRTRPGVLVEYRRGLNLIEKLAKAQNSTSFSSLSFKQREDILDSFLWKYSSGTDAQSESKVSKVLTRLERHVHNSNQRRFRELVVRDLLVQFYEGPLAWSFVGYANFPGKPGDPRAYTRIPQK